MIKLNKPFRTASCAIAILALTACVEGNVEDANAYCEAVDQTLIQAGICADRNSCQKNEYALCLGTNPWTIGTKRIQVYLYRVGDQRVMELVSQSVAAEIALRKGPPARLWYYKGPHFHEDSLIKLQKVD